MKQESYNQKPINIDFPSELGTSINEFDTSIFEKDIKILQEAIVAKTQEIIELENKREQIDERDEEMREKYDIRIEQAKLRLHHLENLVKTDEAHILETNLARDTKAAEIFGGKKEKPEIIQ